MEIKENVAYWCKTEELAKEFLKECEKQSIKWVDDRCTTTETCWEVYKRETCYKMRLTRDKRKVTSFASKKFYEDYNIEIIEYKGVKTMNKEEIQAQIKELQDKLNILSSELEKCENEQVLSIWRPKEKEQYYYIDCFCGLWSETYHNSNMPCEEILFDGGNYYKTKKEAEFEAQRGKYTRLFRKYVKEHSEPMNHHYIKLERFYAYWDIENQTIEIASHKGYIDAFQIYGYSKEVIQDAIKFIGEDNFKKYILEIKE